MLYYNYKIVTHYTIVKLCTVSYVNNTVMYSNVYIIISHATVYFFGKTVHGSAIY